MILEIMLVKVFSIFLLCASQLWYITILLCHSMLFFLKKFVISTELYFNLFPESNRLTISSDKFKMKKFSA